MKGTRCAMATTAEADPVAVALGELVPVALGEAVPVELPAPTALGEPVPASGAGDAPPETERPKTMRRWKRWAPESTMRTAAARSPAGMEMGVMSSTWKDCRYTFTVGGAMLSVWLPCEL